MSLLLLALSWIGYFAPWVPHRAAALNLSGFDLAEWVTFLPGVRDGSLPFGRLHFLAPLAALAILSPLISRRARLPSRTPTSAARLVRVGVSLVGLGGALAILPPYPFILAAPSDPELRPQLLLGLSTLVGWALALYAPRRWTSVCLAAQVGGALAGLGFVVWSFLGARSSVAGLYLAPIGVGWGWVAAVVGFAGMALEPCVKSKDNVTATLSRAWRLTFGR